MTRKRFWTWFAPLVAGDLIGPLLDLKALEYIFKPLLVPALLLYLYLNTRDDVSAFVRLVMGGLILSWVGDVVLMFSDRGELFFAAGLGAFLVAHLLYIAAYVRSVSRTAGVAFLRRRPLWLLPFGLLFVGIYGLLYPALGAMRVPVLAYTATIVLMAVLALNRWGRVPEASFRLILWGALLFILSDAILAIDKFLVTVPHAGVAVMSTYVAAQYLIVEGGIAQRGAAGGVP